MPQDIFDKIVSKVNKFNTASLADHVGAIILTSMAAEAAFTFQIPPDAVQIFVRYSYHCMQYNDLMDKTRKINPPVRDYDLP
jgi:hypothetical protein